MKFEQQLALKTIPSWSPHYLNYKKLKATLYSNAELANGHTDQSTRGEQFSGFRTYFLSEVEKVNRRYDDQESSARDTLKSLKAQWSTNQSDQETEEWKAAFSKLLRQLENLADFTQSNITACRKILKKADKVTKLAMTRELWPIVTSYRFAKSESDEALLHEARAAWRKRTAIPVPIDEKPKDVGARRVMPAVPTVSELDLSAYPVGQISRVWVALAEDGMGLPIRVPVIIAKGTTEGPVVGITAALHGNELNGIPLIHRLISELSPSSLHGTLVAVPVANCPGFLLSQRGYTDGTDLNRVMPGKANGSSPQVYAYNLLHRIIRNFEYLLDLHTASRGRVNSLYVRANLLDPRTARMARLQNPQIIVHNTSPDGSLRGAAMQRGIPAITVEIGDPSRFQKRFVKNALIGVTNILSQLRMIPDEQSTPEYDPVVCTRSFWIFAKSGGILTVIPDVNTWVRAGDLIATIHSVFGDLEEEYYAPSDGIIVGKHVDPVCQSGNRILHLGVVEDELPQVVDDGHM
ncbi:hypothetical protein DL89DRAFT_263710 [Linderina pennispora]|uniref:SPX domain-containing protein n=1 Tax=Linderina pennispora TaxID=61395 RepID=A0A1Y1WJD4_9FUNG|nr:uncharacterized protein DL89DRAFT_263710 [Linderina pennispora]ORX73691.1 hypothetical protein DL89DRAFT_263710 [Linderina pennispora]